MPVPPLLPMPRKLTPRAGGSFRLSPHLPIVLHESSTQCDFHSARRLGEGIARKSGIVLPIETHARVEDLGPRIELRRTAVAGEEYRLSVGRDLVRVSGSGPAGLRYAVETLVQLLPARGRAIAACEIEDAPDLAMRGILLDVSRGKVPTLETLLRLVDFMVELKLNLLMLYTEHVFRFRRHPLAGKDASPMEASELRELDEYAASRHVELVPTLQSLGHMHRWLEHRRYRHLAESDRQWSLSPALEESYSFLDELYSEYLPNFRSRSFNANCDEPVDLGKGRSSGWAEREGRGAVFASHLRRVRELASKYGKKTMVWADFVFEHRESVGLLPPELVLIDWWYEANHDFDRVRLLAERGIPFLTASGTSGWNTLFPRLDNAVANIRGHSAAAKRHGALGTIVTEWGDGGHGNLLGNAIYPFAFAAQAAWGSEIPDRKSFDRAFSVQLFSDPTGSAARLYRSLGSLHETGFDHFNHSPLKSLFFDDLREAKHTSKAKRPVVARTLRALKRVSADFARSSHRLASRSAECFELSYAIEASLVAARKGLAGLEFLEQQQHRERFAAARRRALASELRKLASEQGRLMRELRRLWLARNRPSSFESMASQFESSIRGLRSAAARASR